MALNRLVWLHDRQLIRIGFAMLLGGACRWIEAAWLALKIAADSRRVKGPGHNMTKDADEALEKCMMHYIGVMPHIHINRLFQALWYKNDGEICVVTGPIAEPRQINGERIFHVGSDLIVPNKSCPMFCHGLVMASHMNGKVGDIRGVHNTRTEIWIKVHFEDESANPALVKPKNLWIAFKLPREEEQCIFIVW
jgi:hypothetical protein